MKLWMKLTSTMHYFMFVISYALILFNSKTHQVLVIVHTWFHIDETHFISLLIKLLVSHHLKWWHDILFNMHETLMKPPLELALGYTIYVEGWRVCFRAEEGYFFWEGKSRYIYYRILITPKYSISFFLNLY